ncbi:MAG: Osmosensitive channel histidine kinase KdpD [Myxococcaceae bacterium]|nr:Osmosensitive channel histidine kinase KdpD [Myxococcaceae bacterium]
MKDGAALLEKPVPELPLLDTPRLEQLIDRAALLDVCRSFHESFGIPVRVVSRDGNVLATTQADDSGLLGGPERELAIEYDGRKLGQLIVGPEPFADRRNHLDKLAVHFSRVLDAMLFSGHRALLASTMHLATAESNYRELFEKTESLQLAFDKLKELDRLKSTFLATMSHELRTPLTSIIGYSDMLASGMGGELNPTQREFVDTVRAKGDQLLELILTLLDVAKLEQENVQLALTKVDAAELLRDALRTVSPAAAKKDIKLEQRIEPGLPALLGDKTRLRQVLVNLLENAVKFTPNGGTVSVAAGLSTRAHQPEDGSMGMVLLGTPRQVMQLVVRDNGMGIPATEHERIFDAFYQVDGSATREHGGTGLGLSIVKRLVEAHGGKVELDSTPGQGTEFRVRIPLPA